MTQLPTIIGQQLRNQQALHQVLTAMMQCDPIVTMVCIRVLATLGWLDPRRSWHWDPLRLAPSADPSWGGVAWSVGRVERLRYTTPQAGSGGIGRNGWFQQVVWNLLAPVPTTPKKTAGKGSCYTVARSSALQM